MPVFPKPKFAFEYDVDAEIARLRAHKLKRAIPEHRDDRILVHPHVDLGLGRKQRETFLSL